MNELDRHNLKSGSRVKYFDKYSNRWEIGEVTIIKETTCKIMFDNSDLNYDYYPIDELELIED